jgi:hypothetical protein
MHYFGTRNSLGALSKLCFHWFVFNLVRPLRLFTLHGADAQQSARARPSTAAAAAARGRNYVMEGGNVGSPRDTSGRGRHRHLKVPLSGRGNPATRGRWDDVHDVRPSTMSVPGGDVPLGGRTQLLLLECTHTQLLQRAGWALGQALDRGPARLSVLHLRQLSCQLECQLSSWTVS